jgi:uncharacterized protein YkwD
MHALSRWPGRLLLPALVLAAVLTAALAATSSAAVPRTAGARPAATILRLLKAVRAEHGAAPLSRDPRLNRVARSHSRDMVANRYFSHDSRSGGRFSARIARTGWMLGRRRWRVGENLAWGVGERAAPQAVVAAWLASPPHRRVLLGRAYRVVGIGVAVGTPFAGGSAGRTFTTDFGS